MHIGKCISLFQLKGMQEDTKEVAHGKKITQMQKKSCKIALFSSISATESLKPYTYTYCLFCFVFSTQGVD